MKQACWIFLSVLLVISGPVISAEPCPEKKTWQDCLTTRLAAQSQAQAEVEEMATQLQTQTARDEAEEGERNALLRALVGAASGADFNLGDFLTPFLASLDIAGLDSSGGNLQFQKNFQQAYGVLAVDIQAKEGELFPQIEMALEAADRKDDVATFEKEIGDFDNISAKVEFSFDRDGDHKTWWGRRLRSPVGKLSELTGNGKVAEEVYMAVVGKIPNEFSANLDQAFDEFSDAVRPFANKTPEQTPTAERAGVHAALTKLVQAEKADFEAYKKAITDNYADFAKLVGNQPQFILSIGHEARDELVGRDSWSATLKYEKGWANVNALRDKCKETGLTYTCYRGYLDDNKKGLRHNWRASLEASYKNLSAYDYTSDDGSISLDLEESDAWDVKFSLGCTLRLTNEGLERTRFDLEAMYEDKSDDMMQSRFVATATFTEVINDTMSLSAGFVYANRPEFRGDVEAEFSARAGLRLKLMNKSDGNSGES